MNVATFASYLQERHRPKSGETRFARLLSLWDCRSTMRLLRSAASQMNFLHLHQLRQRRCQKPQLLSVHALIASSCFSSPVQQSASAPEMRSLPFGAKKPNQGQTTSKDCPAAE